MWILDDELESSLPLPSGDRDIPLLIADRSLDRHNQLTNPFRQQRHPPSDGITGHYVLVNGAHLPHHSVSARRYRLRFLNASNFRAYNLYLTDGLPLVQIGSDSGLMPRPVKRSRILLGPAERAEVIVNFSGVAGRAVELRSDPHNDGHHELGTKPDKGPLMKFRVGRRKPDSTSIPTKLRPLPSWTQGLSRNSPVDRHWPITIGGGISPKWLLKGKTFDPARSDAHPVLNTTEVWAVTNQTAVAHVIHMHSTDWYMLQRNGRPPKPWEDCLKESFFINPGNTIHVAARFTNFTGKYVIHCHMLDHEDHGLMDQFEVVASHAKQPAKDEVARKRRGEITPVPGSFSFGLPASATGEAIEFTPVAPPGASLVRMQVAVNGRQRHSLEGGRLAKPMRVELKRTGATRVSVVAHTADGRMLGATREYGR
jgi:FtsP/CotA-like multicopper oxidase with cupredoxin domain